MTFMKLLGMLFLFVSLTVADPWTIIENRNSYSPSSVLPGFEPSVWVWINGADAEQTDWRVELWYTDMHGGSQYASISCSIQDGQGVCAFLGIDAKEVADVVVLTEVKQVAADSRRNPPH